MARRSFPGVLVCAALAVSVGCTVVAPVRTRVPARLAPSPSPVVAAVKPSAPHYAALTETPRLIDQVGVATSLVGKVKLLSDQAAGIIANNSGNIVANNADNIISEHGGGIIANNGGGLVGKTKAYLLAAATASPAPRQEALLAFASIEVLDAEGHYLADKAGKPITAVSDASGSYKLSAVLPDSALILRVRLFNGGQLQAIIGRQRAADGHAVDLDTASTLGARYVLDKFVNHQQAVFDKLPDAEAVTLHARLQDALPLLPAKAPSYALDDMVGLASTLATEAPPVKQELDKIHGILLAGQANLGAGQAATAVSLAQPDAVVGDSAGNLYIGEEASGRVRLVDAKGIMSVYAGGPHSKGESFETPAALLRLPDGSLLMADPITNRVRLVAPDGTVSTFAGNQTALPGTVDVAATAAGLLRPTGIARAADGTVYIAELPNTDAPARLLSVDPKGVIHLVAPPTQQWDRPKPVSVAVAPDGTLYVLDKGDFCIQKRAPDGSWSVFASDDNLNGNCRLTLGPDGSLYVAMGDLPYIVRYLPDGSHITFAGNPAQAGYSPDGTPAASVLLNSPSGMWYGNGQLYVSDPGNGLVQAFDMSRSDHPVKAIAGTRAPTQTGLATNIAISSPTGMAVDPQGRVVVAEATGHTIKRLDGENLVVIAGSSKGPAVDGVPALKAQFNAPSGLAYDGSVLYIMDAVNEQLREIDANGMVKSLVGAIDGETHTLAREMDARMLRLVRGVYVTVGPDHMPYFSDNQRNIVWRLRPDGKVEVVAGLKLKDDGTADLNPGYSGDGGPAYLAKLSLPTGLAFDSKGNLYIADSGNLVIRKVTGLMGKDTPTISTYAGLPLPQFFGMLSAGTGLPNDDGKPASQAALIGPGWLTVDASDNLWVCELGSSTLEALAAQVNLPDGILPKIGARIRRIGPDGIIHTVAGDGTKVLNDPDNDDILVRPLGVVFDGQGQMIVGDAGTNQLKLIPKSAWQTTP